MLAPCRRRRQAHQSQQIEQAIASLHQPGNPLSAETFLRDHCRIARHGRTAVIFADTPTEYDHRTRAGDAFAIAKAFHRIGINCILVYEPEKVLRIQPDIEPGTWSILGSRRENTWSD